MKTRGPNPNPTAQAQSKHCFPLSTKTRHLTENFSIYASISGVFLRPGALPDAFVSSCAGWPLGVHVGVLWAPVRKRLEKGTKIDRKWDQK